MSARRTLVLSDNERAARAARMAAMNADPDIRARRLAGLREWTDEQRAQQSKLMRKQNADGTFQRQRQAKPRRLKIPAHTHPLVRGLYAEVNEQRATMRQIAGRNGVDYSTMLAWRRSMPRIDTLDSALNSLDLELAIVPIGTRDETGFAKIRRR